MRSRKRLCVPSLILAFSLIEISGAGAASIVEVGGSISDVGGDSDVLLEVDYKGLEVGEMRMLYLARLDVRGGAGIGDPHAVAYAVDFRPVTFRFDGSEMRDDSMGMTRFELSGFPVQVLRDIRMQQDVAITISLVDADLMTEVPQGERLKFVAMLSAEALGAKFIRYAGSAPDSTFSGFHLGGGMGEAAERLMIGDSFSVELAIGGMADVAAGETEMHDGTAVQSDVKAYAGLRFFYRDRAKIFIDGGLMSVGDSGHRNSMTMSEIVSGVTFLF